MADDIVTRLQELMADLLYNPDCDDEGCGDCAWHRIGADAINEIERLRSEVESQTFWAELLAGNNCWCVADDVGVCAPCAYRQTMRQNEEARRG